MLLMLDVRPERKPDLETPGKLQVTPPVPYRTYLDSFGNRGTRLVAPAGILQLSNHFTIRDTADGLSALPEHFQAVIMAEPPLLLFVPPGQWKK